MLTPIKKCIYFTVMAVMLTSCATNAVLNKDGRTGATEKSKSIFMREPSDQDLFEDVLSCLTNNSNEPNDQDVKVKLEHLLEKYPQSKWAKSAQSLIDSLERIAQLKEQLKQEKQKSLSDHAKWTREIEGLKENAQKYSAEINRLQQENEQLKNDIHQLKNLEIQLEKREKTRR